MPRSTGMVIKTGLIISHPKEGDDRPDFEIYSVTAILEEYERREVERREKFVNSVHKSNFK